MWFHLKVQRQVNQISNLIPSYLSSEWAAKVMAYVGADCCLSWGLTVL